ncbi:alpha/beta hydrolase [Brachybacterium sp. DNPG3]
MSPTSLRSSAPASAPAPAPAVQKLIDGEWSVERLREHLEKVGTPLITAAGTRQCDVTFVLEAPPSEASSEDAPITLRTIIDRSLPEDLRLQRIEGTDVHHLTLRLPAVLRFAYSFRRGADEALPDPHNDRPVPGGRAEASSVAVLPAAQPLPFLASALRREPAHLEELRIPSASLGAERRVWVSLPPGVADAEQARTTAEPLPVVIVFDGTADHTAPAVRDELVEAALVRPAVVVLVDQEDCRNLDLTGSARFARFLTAELMPLLRDHYGISSYPEDAVLSGSSFGGLCAGWTALHHPETFGAAILQSPSCWHHPDLPGPGEDMPIAVTTPTPTLIRAFQRDAPARIRIFHEVGNLEFGPPPAKVWQVLGNRWLHDILVEKGYETHYREYAGGHDPSWWRGTWADGLRWTLPS